jgi:hypothetical protein
MISPKSKKVTVPLALAVAKRGGHPGQGDGFEAGFEAGKNTG